MNISIDDGQVNLIIFLMGSIFAILKSIDVYLRNLQVSATKATAIAQEETAKAITASNLFKKKE
jgi:hypothetical protein